MKHFLSALTFVVLSGSAFSQVGVGTTTPNSTLDVRGSVSLAYRAFTASTTAAITDNTLAFTGTSAATLTLPTAATVTGRYYWIKNASSNGSDLTIATTSSQTIDGLTTWVLDEQNETLRLFSNGTNWYIVSESLPGASSGTAWIYNGNNVTTPRRLGTTSNYELPFITNNVERMRISNAGNVAIGTSTFNGSAPEKLLVDAGTTSSYNVISGKGNINNYLQLNIQNNSTGANASSDVVATANNGDEVNNYIDMGINSGSYNNASMGILNGANNAYLYSTGNDFILGNGNINRHMLLFTGGTATSNERMRITNLGMVGINNTTPTERLQVEGNIRLSGFNRSIFFDSDTDPYAGIKNVSRTGEINELMLFAGNDVAGAYGPDRIRMASQELHFATTTSAGSTNTGDPTTFYEDVSNVPTRMYINGAGNVGIGTTTFNGTAPERLLVDAGTNGSYNVISGKGNLNSYLQLNIQNASNGNQASSDIVATANNGTETSNFVNLGINSSNYTSTGILGGANNAYLYATGDDFSIGNASSGHDLIFFTNGTNTSNEKMRITNNAVQPGFDDAILLGTSSRRWDLVYAANGTIQTSDVRLKKNILPLAYGLNEIMKMEPVSYDWKSDKGGHKIGLIAQEVRKIVPEVVTGNEATENLGMNYAELVPVLINAVKELKNELNETKKELEELKKQVNKK